MAEPKSKSTALILAIFGWHRIYTHGFGNFLLFWLTCGGLWIWWLMDLIGIITGKYVDGDGQPLA